MVRYERTDRTVGLVQSDFQRCPFAPAACQQLAHIHQLARCAVGLAAVVGDAALKTHHAAHQVGQFGNDHVVADAAMFTNGGSNRPVTGCRRRLTRRRS